MPSRKLIFFAVAAATLFIGGAALYLWDASRDDLIANGVKVGGVDIGGMRADEARAKLQRDLARPLTQPVVVRKGDKTFRLTAQQAQVGVNVRAMVEQAINRSRQDNLLVRGWRGITGSELDADLPPRVSFSQDAVSRLVRKVKRNVSRAPQDATIEPTSERLEKVRGRNGISVRGSALRRRVERLLVHPGGDRTVKPQVKVLKPKVTTRELADKYPDYIVINRDGFQLRYYHRLKLEKSYTIAIGQQGFDTAGGLYDIQNKQVNPTWNVPNSEWAGDLAGRSIPPGPDNPLKARWMAFNGSAGIHGTAETGSLGSAASHGCIRMAIPDVTELYDKVDVHTPVFII